MKLQKTIIFFCYFAFTFVSGNKYTKGANSPSPVDDSKDPTDQNFRVQKLNFIWTKAIRKLTESEQSEFLLHLKKLDKQFLAAKYERSGGADTDGLLEKEVENALENLMNRFGLSAVYDSVASDSKLDGLSKDTRNEARVDAASKSANFKDQKLRRLWLDAVSDGGFDEKELLALEEEFQHHQGKLDDYGKKSADSVKKLSSEEKENSVVQDFDDRSEKPRNNAELKKQFKDIQHDYDKLKLRVADKVKENKMKNLPAISHPRVVALLEKARSMYSGVELESIEEELRHFEVRLKKLEYLEREADRGKDEPDPYVKAKKEKTAKAYNREANEQFSDYSRKVEKYERYLASKMEL